MDDFDPPDGVDVPSVADVADVALPKGATPSLATLLDEIHDFVRRFVYYPSPHAALAHVLWIAHTHQMDAWDSTPRISFLSPEPGSGKTRALEVSELLVPNPVEAVNTTPAYLFRKVSADEGLPTILYDEIDTLFGPKAKDNEEIRGMLNAGHRRGAVAGRCVVKGKVVETEELPAYCAVALAGLGNLPDTILSRSVIIRMKRRAPDEYVEPFRRRVQEKDGHALRDRLTAWASVQSLEGCWPDMPDGIEDRDADVWEALLAVADAAGGEWPSMGRKAAMALVAESKGSTPSLGVRLLADLRSIWNGADLMHTIEILKALNDLDDAPWGDLRGKPLDSRALARLLSGYQVKPANVRIGTSVVKGYKRECLHDAWQRYLPPEAVGVPPMESATSATSATRPCDVCGLPLDPTLAAFGETTHATCDVKS